MGVFFDQLPDCLNFIFNLLSLGLEVDYKQTATSTNCTVQCSTIHKIYITAVFCSGSIGSLVLVLLATLASSLIIDSITRLTLATLIKMDVR